MDIWSTADIVISDDHDSLTGQTLMRPGSGVFEVFASSIEDDAHKILATKTGIHYTASRLHNWEADVAACKGDAQCVQAIKEQAAIVEDGNLLIGMGDLLRKMGLAHHCKMGASRTSGHKPA